MANVNPEIAVTIANIIKSPVDAIAIVKSSNGQMTPSTIAGMVGMASTLASVVAANPALQAGLSKLGLGASIAGLGIDASSVYSGKYDDKTLMSLSANTLAVAGGILAFALGGEGDVFAAILGLWVGGAVGAAQLNTDAIYGGGGNDTLVGSALNDFLVGGDGSDELYGGTGFDTYITGDGDTISDSDGKGLVTFEGDILKGGTLTESHELYDQYDGDGGTYYLLKTNNTLIYKKGEKFLTIENFTKELNDLEIVLENKELEISIYAPTVSEKDATATGAVTLNHAYSEDLTLTSGPVDKDITIDLQTINGSATSGNDYMGSQDSVTIKAASTSAHYNVMIFKDDDTDEGSESFYLAPMGYAIADNFEREAA